MRTTLFVAGFGNRTRARDLGYEFERYGRLVRCDIPAPKNHASKPYAFVEFEDPRDAEDSFKEMHGRRLDGYTLSVQWARNAPSSSWRYDRSPHRPRSPSPPELRHHPFYGSRSPSPYGNRSPPLYPPPLPSHSHYSGRYYYHNGPPSPLRGRSPPPPRRIHGRGRYYRSRSPIGHSPTRLLDADYPSRSPVGRYRSRSPVAQPYDDYPYPPPPLSSSANGRFASSMERRRDSRSPSPPPSVLRQRRPTPFSMSPSPHQRSTSPKRSRSPDQ